MHNAANEAKAFTIYTFLQLLVNFLGGERSLIIMMHGRRPVHHPWPLNYCFPDVDISDPHTFLSVKRGILQYAWIKPILGIATVIMQFTGTYKEGYLGLTSGYLWSSIIYNISITLSLYSLAMFWVCMSQDLQPFRPMPKFLCIKLIIFASYWQGFFLSILQWLGAIPNDVPGYTPDNLAAAIQDALICLEMPIFAVSHWYAFSWHDYADVTISAARMPVKYALRDTFGIRDLIEDAKETFGGQHYEYRVFDTGDDVLAHEGSGSRVARMMEGMRYERGGKGKYWIPKPGEVNSRTPLLGPNAGSSQAAPMSYSKPGRTMEDELHPDEVPEDNLDMEDERLFSKARALEFGDWDVCIPTWVVKGFSLTGVKYPVITAHVPSADRWLNSDPNLITTSTNRHLLQPTKVKKARRASSVQKGLDKGKRRTNSPGSGRSRSRIRAPVVEDLIREESSSSAKSGRSQLVDLVIEDKEAEQTERVRARKEGGAEWNEDEAKHYIRTYDDEDEGEDIRDGFDPSKVPPAGASKFAVGDEEDEEEAVGSEEQASQSDEAQVWAQGEPKNDSSRQDASRERYDDLDDRHVWKSRDRGENEG